MLPAAPPAAEFCPPPSEFEEVPPFEGLLPPLKLGSIQASSMPNIWVQAALSRTNAHGPSTAKRCGLFTTHLAVERQIRAMRPDLERRCPRDSIERWAR